MRAIQNGMAVVLTDRGRRCCRRRVTKLEKKYKKGPIVTVSMPAIAEKLFEGKRPMKRTPFTDRMWTLFGTWL